MVQNWLAQGRPSFTGRRLGSYEAWSQVVGGVLEAAGVKGFLENLSTFTTRADAETAEWRRFLTAWHEKYQGSAVDTGALFPLAETALPEVLGDGPDRSQRIRLGKALAKRVGWTFKISAAGGDLILRITENEGEDADKRKRNAWALSAAREAAHIGTSGPTSATSCEHGENERPNVPPASKVLAGTLGRVEAHTAIEEFADHPKVPMSIASPAHFDEDMAEWTG